MNKNMNKDLGKREKAVKLSDAVGGLSEKTVLDTDRKRDGKSSAEAEGRKTNGKRTARMLWIPLASAAVCAIAAVAVLFGGGLSHRDNIVPPNTDDVTKSTDWDTENTAESPIDASTPEITEENTEGTDQKSEADVTKDTDTIKEITETKTQNLPPVNVKRPGLLDMSLYTDVLAQAKYPDAAPYPNAVYLYGDDWIDMWKIWSDERQERLKYSEKIDGDKLSRFFGKTASAFLTNSEGENRIYSPVNVYVALSMLAEISGGESRKQILELTEADSIEKLRTQVSSLWKLLYRNDGAGDTVLANSLWINKGIEINPDAANRVAEEYFASVYRGDTASEETLTAMKKWLNDQTGGLLEDSVNNFTLSPDTVMSLCSTVLFHGKWHSSNEFDKENTEIGIFHGFNGDTEAEFMNQTYSGDYFWGENYGATKLDFETDGQMWFILPDEGKSVDDVLNSGEFSEMFKYDKWEDNTWDKRKDADINIRLPKFDVSSDMELSEGLKALGVTDVFDSEKADFSPLLKDSEGVYLNKAEHAARVVIDEEGCTAAAFTAMVGAMGGPPDYEDVDFVLDRPFIFAITDIKGEILFMGCVYTV